MREVNSALPTSLPKDRNAREKTDSTQALCLPEPRRAPNAASGFFRYHKCRLSGPRPPHMEVYGSFINAFIFRRLAWQDHLFLGWWISGHGQYEILAGPQRINQRPLDLDAVRLYKRYALTEL
ncbi:hypothetical protein MMC10_008746 [Thelotrema lepadinum]|nr:hypothetical protein [Thelotrema lepadinum]